MEKGGGEECCAWLGLLMRYVGVECRDDGLLAAVGGRGGLIRTGWACCGARDQPASLARQRGAEAPAPACDRITLASLSPPAHPNQQRPTLGPPRACEITTPSALPISSASPAVDDLKSPSIATLDSLHHIQPPASSHPPLPTYPPIPNSRTFTKNASQSTEDSHHWRQGPGWKGACREEGSWQEDRCSLWRQEEAHQDQEGDLLQLHLQG